MKEANCQERRGWVIEVMQHLSHCSPVSTQVPQSASAVCAIEIYFPLPHNVLIWFITYNKMYQFFRKVTFIFGIIHDKKFHQFVLRTVCLKNIAFLAAITLQLNLINLGCLYLYGTVRTLTTIFLIHNCIRKIRCSLSADIKWVVMDAYFYEI